MFQHVASLACTSTSTALLLLTLPYFTSTTRLLLLLFIVQFEVTLLNIALSHVRRARKLGECCLSASQILIFADQ